MNLTDKELEELKVILIQKDWIVYAYLDNKEVYVSTEYGLDMYFAFCQWTEYGYKLDFTDMERPIAKQEELEKVRRHLLAEKVITRCMDWSQKKAIYTATPLGQKLFEAWEYWNDTKLQKKMADRKALKKNLKTVGNGVLSFLKNMQKYSQPPEYKKIKRKHKR